MCLCTHIYRCQCSHSYCWERKTKTFWEGVSVTMIYIGYSYKCQWGICFSLKHVYWMYHTSAKIQRKSWRSFEKKSKTIFLPAKFYALFSSEMNLFSTIPKVRNCCLKMLLKYIQKWLHPLAMPPCCWELFQCQVWTLCFSKAGLSFMVLSRKL